MTLILCPGIHPPAWTTAFWAHLGPVCPPGYGDCLIFRTSSQAQWSPYALRQFCTAQSIAPPIILLAYSAGCVAATGMAHDWAQRGQTVAALIAIDGWGVPTVGPWPTYRLSHDAFTHTTSLWLGAGRGNFYASPSVAHAAMWCSPHQVVGYAVPGQGQPMSPPQPMTALRFLVNALEQVLQRV